MDRYLWIAIIAALVAGAASVTRYRFLVLAAALVSGGAILFDYWTDYQGQPSASDLPTDQNSAVSAARDNPVAWSRLFINSTPDPKSGKPASISSLDISGTNVGSEDIKLEEAYFLSGIDGTKLNARIGRDGGRYRPEDMSPLPPGAFFFVVSDPIGPNKSGLSPDDFLKTWSAIYFITKYNGAIQKIEFDRKTVESMLLKSAQP